MSTKPENQNPSDTKNTEKFDHLLQTPLLSEHLNLGARVVDFGGWALPVNYGSQVDEHHAIRKDVGMFDVSHMTVSDITGPDTIKFLSHLLANDIGKAVYAKPKIDSAIDSAVKTTTDESINTGRALYSCMLNEQGGVIDDLIAYRLSDEHCRLVTNAATNVKDMAWIKKQAEGYSIEFTEQPELALIAVQGPNAIKKVIDIFPSYAQLVKNLKRFQGGFADRANHIDNTNNENSHSSDTFIGRTGYTGEDGVEIILPAAQAGTTWQALINAGVQPCGLGARDTLRLEAGMALYGNDLDEKHNPIESGLKWTVSLDEQRDFIGKAALLKKPAYKTIGLILEDRGVLRGHQNVIIDDQIVGEITSGTFSPTLEKSIAIARISVNANAKLGDFVHVEVRNKHLKCQVVKYPFI